MRCSHVACIKTCSHPCFIWLISTSYNHFHLFWGHDWYKQHTYLWTECYHQEHIWFRPIRRSEYTRGSWEVNVGGNGWECLLLPTCSISPPLQTNFIRMSYYCSENEVCYVANRYKLTHFSVVKIRKTRDTCNSNPILYKPFIHNGIRIVRMQWNS
jgi:hypothetical protein